MSGKQSSTRRKRRTIYTFLLDENISGPSLSDPLRRFDDWKIEVHRDHFEKRSTSDEEIVNYCAAHGWALITVDEMRYTPETKLAIVRGNVHVFKLITHKYSHSLTMLADLIHAKPQMQILRGDNGGSPFCAHIQKGGRINVVTRFEEYRTERRHSESQLRTMRRLPGVRWGTQG